MINPMQKAMSLWGMDKPDGFNAYGLGNKYYNGGRPMPNIGASGSQGRLGYKERDNALAAKRQAMLQRMQAGQLGDFASANFMRGQV